MVSAIQIDRFIMRCDVYLAGPLGFVTAAANVSRVAGLPQQQILATVIN